MPSVDDDVYMYSIQYYFLHIASSSDLPTKSLGHSVNRERDSATAAAAAIIVVHER